MNYQSFSEIFNNLENKQLLEDRDIYVLLSGDKEWLGRNFRLNSKEPRIEQHIEIAEHIWVDDGSYTEISKLELNNFNLLEEVLELLNFNGSYSQYKELIKIIKSRTITDENVTYLILYLFVSDLLKIIKL